jgi:hypothetical protein
MNGIIVGADLTQEWLLPWWWAHYSKHNDYPVAFIDFGMSFEMKDWCKARGQHIRLRLVDFAAEKEAIDPNLAHSMESEFGSQVWECRNAWFKKPFACLLSPFQKTIWIDLDCEIRGSLSPLFEYKGLALAKSHDLPNPYQIYNSGIMTYDETGLSLIKEWADWCFKRSDIFRGDQEVLSHMIGEKNLSISELPPIYNWSRCSEENPDALILHWHGTYGKCVIKNQMQLD